MIDGANAFGITGYFAASTFEDNTISEHRPDQKPGQIRHGLRPDLERVHRERRRAAHPAVRRARLRLRQHAALQPLREDRLQRRGRVRAGDDAGEELHHAGVLLPRPTAAGCRTFGGDSLAATTVYNMHLLDNIIVDIPGNVDGCHPSRAAFGMGLYIDNYSRDVEASGNTVISTTVGRDRVPALDRADRRQHGVQRLDGHRVQRPHRPGRQRDAGDHDRQRALRAERQGLDLVRCQPGATLSAPTTTVSFTRM